MESIPFSAHPTMTGHPKETPSKLELKAALVAIKSAHPELGITKTHSLLLASFPNWAVSEKRTRKVLQDEGLVHNSESGPNSSVPPPEAGAVYLPPIYPTSCLIPGLDLPRWTNKVQVKYFDKKKGKGLVAVQDIAEGEILWREDPFIIAPEWEIYDLQTSSAACGFCTTPLDPSSPLILSCNASTSASFCPFRFCNRLCMSRSAKNHPLLCPSQNPASIPLLAMAREARWMALHALANCTARVLLSSQRSAEEVWRDWAVVRGLAELGMEERFKYSSNLADQPEPDRDAWKKAHTLFVQAFRAPPDMGEHKKLAKLLKRPPPPEIERDLFEFDSGFLKALGRMSLNLEAHGGLYTLHSHLNHSCTPNVSVRHLDKRTALARITLLAKRPIKVGEELFITYVNPDMGVRARREELRAWGFGDCLCARCIREAKMLPQLLLAENVIAAGKDALDDLAKELKAGLGVI